MKKVLVTVAIIEFAVLALFGGTPVQSGGAAVNSFIISTSAKDLQVLEVQSSNVAAQFIQLFDSKTLPADGAVPAYVITVQATSSVFRDFANPMHFNNGIVVCNSTTAPTKTIGAADCVFSASTR